MRPRQHYDEGALSNFISSLVVGVAAAWVTAALALQRFRREKIWERKAIACSEVFNAVHDIRLWIDGNIAHQIELVTLPDDDRSELRRSHKAALAVLDRRIDADFWLLPEPFIKRVKELRSELSEDLPYPGTPVVDHLVKLNDKLRRGLNDLKQIVRLDLGLDETPGSWLSGRIWNFGAWLQAVARRG